MLGRFDEVENASCRMEEEGRTPNFHARARRYLRPSRKPPAVALVSNARQSRADREFKRPRAAATIGRRRACAVFGPPIRSEDGFRELESTAGQIGPCSSVPSGMHESFFNHRGASMKLAAIAVFASFALAFAGAAAAGGACQEFRLPELPCGRHQEGRPGVQGCRRQVQGQGGRRGDARTKLTRGRASGRQGERSRRQVPGQVGAVAIAADRFRIVSS